MIYYNDIDPVKTRWLEELCCCGSIPRGVIDQSDIWDIIPSKLFDYKQCHFFAGIGVWASALKKAGWTNENVWTASLPCQPFSAAGNKQGFDDERHLWPAFFHLVQCCQPLVVLGEQVSSPDGIAWLDHVSNELEAVGYTFGAVIASAAGFGAPMRSERTYWMATARGKGPQGWDLRPQAQSRQREIGAGCSAGGLAPANGWLTAEKREQCRRQYRQQPKGSFALPRYHERRGPTNGFWRDADWLRCKDERWRPVEPSTFPLADGVVGRVGLQRGYGDAIVEPQAIAFARAALEWETLA